MSSKGSAPASTAGDDLDDAATGSAPADAGTTAAGDEGEEDSSTVLLTVKQDADGNFVLIEGDEDEGAETGDPSMEGGATPEGQTFDSVGALLKAIGDICKNAQSSGAGTDDENFDSGFTASKKPTPAS